MVKRITLTIGDFEDAWIKEKRRKDPFFNLSEFLRLSILNEMKRERELFDKYRTAGASDNQ